MKIFTAGNWKEVLALNGLHSFEDIWNLEVEWIEEPNIRRGGWSGASRAPLTTADGSNTYVYIKKQQNHFCRSLIPPRFRVASFEREFRNLSRFEKKGIPVVPTVFFGRRHSDGNVQAILITQALDEYTSLNQWNEGYQEGLYSKELKQKLIHQLANLARDIHNRGFEHGALYGEHIFLRYDEALNKFDIKLIDLEFGRRHPKRVVRDIARFYKRTPNINAKDALSFLRLYLEEEKHSERVKAFLRKTEARIYRRKLAV